MTRGEWLLGINFNPSNDDKVGQIKRRAADLIDYIIDNEGDPRCASLAVTAIEKGAMWAVKSITKTPEGGIYDEA